MPLLLDDGSRPDAYRLGDDSLDKVYLGDEQVWPALPLLPGGMNFTGSRAVSTTRFDLSGFVPRSGYPATIIQNGTALVISGSGVIKVYGGASPGNAYMRWVVQHHTASGMVERVSGQNATSGASAEFAVAAGDILTMNVGTTFGSMTLTSAYVYFEVISTG